MPELYIITGSNGTGKSSVGPEYIPVSLQHSVFTIIDTPGIEPIGLSLLKNRSLFSAIPGNKFPGWFTHYLPIVNALIV